MIQKNHKWFYWSVFAATATFCAFFLPVHIALLLWATPPGKILFIFFSALVIMASLYHSFYRIKASDSDLKLIRASLIWMAALTILIAIIQNV